MKDLHSVFSSLRKKGKEQYTLLSGCLFFSSMLITAFCMILYSPTVQNTLPPGGDSRKQVMMVFVLAVIGCAAFCVYAAGLFFRYKSREAGVFLALGISRRELGRQFHRELIQISLGSCLSGILLGTPVCWIIWWIFRITLVNTPEMLLIFDLRGYIIPALFLLFALTALLLMQHRFLARVNVLDIIQESHRAESVHAVPRWYGWGGILMILAGGLLGYFMPTFFILVLHWYAPSFITAVFYLPALIGLYWVLLYTVVDGWHHGKKRYAHLIENGMMQFQGRQTVRNMLVITVLIAGAYFAAFYVPTLMTGGKLEISNRPVDYSFFYRADQNQITRSEIEALAQSHGVVLADYTAAPSASLAVDGEAEVEAYGPLGTTYTLEYRKQLKESRFFPVSSWNAFTGDSLTLRPGECAATLNRYGEFIEIKLVTNPFTGNELPVTTIPTVLNSEQFRDILVLSDSDYASITQGLPADWQEMQVVFNAPQDSYPFAKALFDSIVQRSSPETALWDGYDRIIRANTLASGKAYWADDPEGNHLPVIDLEHPDSSDFRTNWMYMPRFRILDENDFVSNFAVFLLLFLFVSILCFAAVMVILYTRSQTLILSNLLVYEDLRKLGASNRYLCKTSKGQIRRVFFAPVLIGTFLIFSLFLLILSSNSGSLILDHAECLSLGYCLLIIAAMSGLLYLLYRKTVKKAWHTLHLQAL